MTIGKSIEIFQTITYRYLTEMYALNNEFKQGRSTRAHYELMVDHHDNIYRMNVRRIFDRLSWEEQIQLCIEAQDPTLVSRLDSEQLTAYWIVK